MNDRMAILDTRASGPVSQRLKWLDLVDFPGINGDGSVNLQGFDVYVGENDPPTLRMLLVNNRPFLDPVTGALLDGTNLGANATIELFETTLGSTELRYVKTYHDPAIQTPNNVAFMGPDAFVLTNDRSVIHGFVCPPSPLHIYLPFRPR
jgi:arylesterase/paraoxonase